MTKVDILEETAESGKPTFRAVAGDKQSVGRSAGEALDALTAQLPADEAGTLVVVQARREFNRQVRVAISCVLLDCG